MKSSEPKIDPKIVQLLSLARVQVSQKRTPSQRDVVKAVATAICPPLSKAAAEQAAARALADCERAGWITSAKAARSRAFLLSLTPAGKQHLGRSAPRRIASWEHAQRLVALSAIGRSDAADERLDVDALAAVILGERHGVRTDVRGLQAVVDHLAWRALGVDTTRRFDVEAVQRHLLRQLVPEDVRVDRTVWRRMLAMRAVNARGTDARALTQALLTRQPKRRPKRAANTNDPRSRAQPSLADFAAAVREAAGMPTVARFHDRAYIGSVWDHLRGRGPAGHLTLPEFKQLLVAAHRDGLLRITRADLVGAMDRDEVDRSEARYRDATFHFVALDAGGMG